MNFRPLHDYVLIERTTPDEKTKFGIIIPETAREKNAEGVVRAVGPGGVLVGLGVRVPPIVQVGERVLFGKYNGAEIKVDGQDYLLIKEVEIYGVIEDDATKPS